MSTEVKALRKGIKRDVKTIICILLAIVLFGAGMATEKMIIDTFNKKKVTTQYVSGKLEDMAELTTQQVTYSGRKSVEEGTIPFITEKGFTMFYNATMKAGINFEDMEIKVKKDVVQVKVPHAEVLSNKVDPTSIQFEDEKKAVFNWNNQEDVAEALVLAESDVEKNKYVDYSALTKAADERTEKLVYKFLENSVGDREIEVDFK